MVSKNEKPDLRAFGSQLSEIDVEIKIHRISTAPSFSVAVDLFFAAKPLAVVWHDEDSRLNLLFIENGVPEKINVEPGENEEEILYLKELLEARFDKDEDYISDLLVEVPYESAARLGEGDGSGSSLKDSDSSRRRRDRTNIAFGKWGFGVGYRVRLHPDDVFWASHGLQIHVPIGIIKEKWVIRSAFTIVLPTSFERRDGVVYKISGTEISFGGGYIPVRFGTFGIEVGLLGGTIGHYGESKIRDAGVVNSEWLNAITEKYYKISGHLDIFGAIFWHASSHFCMRFYFESGFVFGAPKFKWADGVEIGRFPWQPAFGIDISITGI